MRHLVLFASVLVVPLALLLFLQWPLREWVQAYAQQTNDLGQIIFALYVAVAVYAASARTAHLAVLNNGVAPSLRARRWAVWATLLCVGPWSAFMLWAAAGPVVQAVIGLEHFPDTGTPGYFVIKLALGLLLLLVLVGALTATLRSVHSKPEHEHG